jgi:hypothetical protein
VLGDDSRSTGIVIMRPDADESRIPHLQNDYQLDFVTPGISPDKARLRKQMRHNWNFLRYPRGRPQRRQRLCPRTWNFGFCFALAIMQVFATLTPVQKKTGSEDQPAHINLLSLLREGHS